MNDALKTAVEYWQEMSPNFRAILILAGGLLAANLVRILGRLFLRILRFDKICHRIGFTEFLRKGGIQYTPTGLIGTLSFWAVILTVFLEVSRQLNFHLITEVYSRFGNIVPGLIAAALILLTGWILLEFSANFTITLARNAGILHAELLGQAIRYMGLLLLIILAVGQVEIGTGVLGLMLLVFFSGLCLAFALAFGLGCQEMAREIVQKILTNLREQSRQGKSSDLEG